MNKTSDYAALASKLRDLAASVQAIKADDYEHDATELFDEADAEDLRVAAVLIDAHLSTRDLFAARAMQAMCGNSNIGMDEGGIAYHAYKQADAMLKAREEA